jgi:phospholipase C
LFPTPIIGDTFALTFITEQWCYHADPSIAASTTLTLDTDVHVYPERLFELGVKWRFLRAKGLSYDEERDEFDKELELCRATASPARTLSLTRGRRGVHFVDYQNVPDTGFGV